MTDTEQQPTPRPPQRYRFQFTLRTLFVLSGITAIFFSLARSLGYVDAMVAFAASAVLFGVMCYPRRVHLATGVLLMSVAGTLLWANLRPTEWEHELNEAPPKLLDPLTKAMFYRGWPLSPFMICPFHGMRFRPEEFFVQIALIVDGMLFVMALVIVRFACEACFRMREKRRLLKGALLA